MNRDKIIERIRDYLIGCQEDPLTGRRDLDYAERTAYITQDRIPCRIVSATVDNAGQIAFRAVMQGPSGDTGITVEFPANALNRVTDSELTAIADLCEYAFDRALSDYERRKED